MDIYTKELELKLEHIGQHASFLNLDITIEDNIFIFEGKDNPLTMTRVYDVEWICDYNMRWYPFDSQVS